MGLDDVRRTIEHLVARREPAPPPTVTGALARWSEAVRVARATEDQLPPVVRNRSDFLGRLELRVKELLARAVRWGTWAQVEHNRAVSGALAEAHALAESHALRIEALHEAQRHELVARERQHAERRAELHALLEQRLAEQEVRIRQLELQLAETHQLADRFRRGATLRIEELEDRLAGEGSRRRLP